MTVNKYKPHVYVIPEDDADRQLVQGFLDHWAVVDGAVSLRPPAGGWGEVLGIFEREYVKTLIGNEKAHVVMLIDFDDKEINTRRARFEEKIPQEVTSRVFLIGSKVTPERLKGEFNLSLEKIGFELAQDCSKDDLGRWSHPHLSHNSDELKRMVQVIKPILFK